MTELVTSLKALAFERAELSAANAAIDAVRVARETQSGSATSYEVALPAVNIDEFLTRKTLPKLVYFLDCRGEVPPRTPRTFVSLFTPEGLFFIEAGAVAMLLATKLGVSTPAELIRRYGANGTGDPKQLGA